MATENLKTTDGVEASREPYVPRGTFIVTAKQGIQVDGETYENGDEVELEGAVVQALMNEGSIKQA